MSIELGENETRHEQGNDVYCELTDAEGGYLDHDIVYIGPIDGRHTVEYMFTLAHNYGFLDEMREAWAGQTQISREDDLSQPLRAAVKQSVLVPWAASLQYSLGLQVPKEGAGATNFGATGRVS